MNLRVIISSVLVLCVLGITSQAQNIQVSAGLDTNAIMIGQQFRLKLRVQHPANGVVVWPYLKDTLTKGVEIVDIEKTDTTFSTDKSQITYSAGYILTSFDSGVYAIPPIPFSFTRGRDTETVYSNLLNISVFRPEVDTTQEIRDIKGPAEIPFDWKEALPYVIGGFAVILFVVLMVWFIRRQIAKRKAARAQEPQEPIIVIPPHEMAQKALQELREKQLWQRGKTKEYYTELTDILRIYIRDRFDVDAPEMVSEEIIRRLKFKPIAATQREVLASLLQLADMVKFAKLNPGTFENEECLNTALLFVENTRPVDSESEKEKGGEADEH
ncbi:MAG: BatD family protein [Flavobacteriales bacterium]|nr:BatD family protein [Flavobacteriales bacterium]